MWPIRTHICTVCRTLYEPEQGRQCSCGYGIVDARDPGGYAWLSRYALGHPSIPRAVPEPVVGVVQSRSVLPSPIGRYPCVAYAVQFPAMHDGSLMVMRDAACLAFDVVREDGRRLRVNAGRVRLYAPSAQFAMPGMVQSFVRSHSRWQPVGADPFQTMVAVESVIFPGVEIAVHAPVIQQPDARAVAGYREAATMDVAAGVPYLRVTALG